jgi:hypothetical protein
MGFKSMLTGITNDIGESRTAPRQLLFRQLARQYQTVRDAPPPAPGAQPAPDNPGLKKAIDDLIKKGTENPPLSWLELYDLESMILRVLDDASLRDEAWAVREEFRGLATAELYEAYRASGPPDPRDPKTPPGAVRTDVEGVLRKIQELRIGRSYLDVIRGYTTGLTFCVAVLIVVMTLWIGLSETKTNVPVLLLVCAGGAFGAGISMLQRLSQIPSKGDLVARYPNASRKFVWMISPLLNLAQGSLAAVVLYFIFRAGLLEGPLFPKFTAAGVPAATQPAVQELLHGELPTGGVVEAAKLFVWSLVSGTAERLVPDLLTRLSDQAQKSELASQKPI